MTINKSPLTALLTGLLLASSQMPARAAELSSVEGYVTNNSGTLMKTASGECLRTRFKDAREYPAECGYEVVVEKAAVMGSSPSATAVTVAGAAGIVKGDKVVAASDVVIEQVVIPNVEFAFDSAELTSGYKEILDTASEILKPHRPLLRQGVAKLNVVGYTDASGNEEYNQKLSERRAKTVAEYLIMQDPSRKAFVQAIGRGEQDPVASNDTAEGRQQNRRVALQIVGK